MRLGDDVVGLVRSVGLGECVNVRILRPVTGDNAEQALFCPSGVGIVAVERIDGCDGDAGRPCLLKGLLDRGTVDGVEDDRIGVGGDRLTDERGVVGRIQLGVIDLRLPTQCLGRLLRAPSAGISLLLVSCAAEMMIIDLFLTAGRGVGSTLLLVPTYSALVAVWAAWRVAEAVPPPPPELGELVVELDEPDELQAASAAAAVSSTALRRIVLPMLVIISPFAEAAHPSYRPAPSVAQP